MADRMSSPAYAVLRPSSKRLLMYVEQEIGRAGGGSATFYNDQFEIIGSRRVYLCSLSELNALGLLRVARYQKRYLISLSDGWRGITKREAALLSARARTQPMPTEMTPSRPALASTNAP